MRQPCSFDKGYCKCEISKSRTALSILRVNTENGVKPHEAMMLFNPMDGFMNKTDEM